jgi:hypothetical protein
VPAAEAVIAMRRLDQLMDELAALHSQLQVVLHRPEFTPERPSTQSPSTPKPDR